MQSLKKIHAWAQMKVPLSKFIPCMAGTRIVCPIFMKFMELKGYVTTLEFS